MTGTGRYCWMRVRLGGLIALGALAILLVCASALPGRADAFAVYNQTNVDAGNSAITYDGATIHAEAHSPNVIPSSSDFKKDIAPGDNEGCSYKDDDCGNGDKNAAFRLTVTVDGDVHFACDVAMKAGGFVMVRVRRRTYQPSMTSLPLEYYCDSRFDHDGTEDQIDEEPHFIGRLDRDIAFTVTGDPQYNIAEGPGSDGYKGADATLNAMRGFFSDPTVRGAIVAGDLTQTSRPIDEWRSYRAAIGDLKPGDDYPTLRPGVAGSTTYWEDYPQGLGRDFFDTAGNHDGSYPSSASDTNYTACETGLSFCQDPDAIYREMDERDRTTVLTKRASSDYMHDPPQNQPPGMYSWDWNDIHFVNLGVMGADEKASADIDISKDDRCTLYFDSSFKYCNAPDYAGPDPGKALQFLKDDLAANVGSSGRPVVIVQHYGIDTFSTGQLCTQAQNDDGTDIAGACRMQVWWTPSQQTAEWNALASYNVVAMFAGHVHLHPGDPGWKQTWTKPTGATGGPASLTVYTAGGAMNKVFLFARITDTPSSDDPDCHPTGLQSCLEVYRETATGGTGWTQDKDSTGASLVDFRAIGAPPTKVVPNVRLVGPATATIAFTDAYTATVSGSSPRGGTPTGKVTFTSDGTQIPGCIDVPLDNLEARCQPSFSDATALAVHHVQAHYSGNDYFAAADSNAVDTALGAAPTRVAFLGGTNFQSGAPTELSVSVSTDNGVAAVGGTVSFQQDADLAPLPQGQCADPVPVVDGKATCHLTFDSDTRLPIRIRATYSGNSVFGGGWASMDGFVLPATHTTVVSNRNPAGLGEKVTYTATVTAAAGVDQPTGLVEFSDADGEALVDDQGNPVCVQVALVDAKAACPDVHLRHVADGGKITARYESTNHPNLSDSSGTVDQVVTKGASTTTISSSPDPSVTGQDVDVVATVAPTAPASVRPDGTVDFSVGGTPVAACTGVPLTSDGAAECRLALKASQSSAIAATYSGSVDLEGSTGTKTLAVDKAQTATSVWRPGFTSPETGQATAITAGVDVPLPAVGTATGKIRFSSGGTTISGCEAVAIDTSTNTATCNAAFRASQSPVMVTATYLGDDDFASSTSGPLSFTVEQGYTTLGLSAPDTSLVSGQQAKLTATVSAPAPGGGTPGGPVTFYAGTTKITGCESLALSGGAATCTTSFRLAGWPGYVTAKYAGDADYKAAEGQLGVSMARAATTTALAATPSSAVSGQDVIYRATVSVTEPGSGTPTGTVAFRDGDAVIEGCDKVDVTDGAAECKTHHRASSPPHVTASYSGDDELDASTSDAVAVTVGKAQTAVGLQSSSPSAVVGQPVALTATPTVRPPGAGEPTGTVTFHDGSTAIAGCTDVALDHGSATCATAFDSTAGSPRAIRATYSGDDDLGGSVSDAVSQAVSKASSKTTLSSSANPSVTGQEITLTAAIAVVAPGSTSRAGTVSFDEGDTPIAGCDAVPVASGGTATCTTTYGGTAGSPHQLRAVYSGNENLDGSSDALAQTVDRAATQIAWTQTNPPLPLLPTSITVSVTPQAPGSGTPTGQVSLTRLDLLGLVRVKQTKTLVDGRATFAVTGLGSLLSPGGGYDVSYTGSADYEPSRTTVRPQ